MEFRRRINLILIIYISLLLKNFVTSKRQEIEK